MIHCFKTVSLAARRAAGFAGMAAFLWASACACAPEIVENAFTPGDLTPPTLVSWSVDSSRSLSFVFDEDVSADADDFNVDGGLAPDLVTAAGRIVTVGLDGDQQLGTHYAAAGLVADAAGNTSRFVVPFSGYNSRVPVLVINEILCEGSSTHPDVLELRAKSAGNIAGVVFIVGAAGAETLRYDFPAAEVAPGDFIVLHLKPSGTADEVDETGGTAVSGGADATPGGRDFWFREAGGGLPNANGVLVLHAAMPGRIIDAVAYSERTSQSDSKYGGFGTQAFRTAVETVVEVGAWLKRESNARPEDCVPSGSTTSTRTICRSSGSDDGDQAEDWHIAPSRGATIGATNTDEVYTP